MKFILFFLTFLFSSQSTDLLLDMYTVNNWKLVEILDDKNIYQANSKIYNDKYIKIEQQVFIKDVDILSTIESVSNYNSVLSNNNINTELLFNSGDTLFVLQTITNAIPFTRDRKYIFKLYRVSQNRIDWFMINKGNPILKDYINDAEHILSFGAGSWEIKQKGDQKVLIYRMYLDDEVSLPLIFIQKLRKNHAVDIFNDVLTFSQGEK
jgi:hypothetical protein